MFCNLPPVPALLSVSVSVAPSINTSSVFFSVLPHFVCTDASLRDGRGRLRLPGAAARGADGMASGKLALGVWGVVACDASTGGCRKGCSRVLDRFHPGNLHVPPVPPLSCLPQYQKEKKTPWVLTVAATGTVAAQLLIRGPAVVNQLLMLQEATEAELRDEADKINGLLVKIDGLNRLNFAKDIHDKISSAHVRPHHCSNTPQMTLSDV